MPVPRFTIYEQLGGDAAFHRLAETFYDAVDADSVLRPMFPPDLSGAKERLALFLIQYFGGPETYSERRGHPRLRMRHVPFVIGVAERDRWVGHMLRAIEANDIPEPSRGQMIDYFQRTATFLINRPDDIAVD